MVDGCICYYQWPERRKEGGAKNEVKSDNGRYCLAWTQSQRDTDLPRILFSGAVSHSCLLTNSWSLISCSVASNPNEIAIANQIELLASPLLLFIFYLITCRRTSSRHVLQGSSSVWLQEKFAFHTSQGEALIQRRAHKTPVAVHLHQFEYLTPNRDQTLISNAQQFFVHSMKGGNRYQKLTCPWALLNISGVGRSRSFSSVLAVSSMLTE